MEKQVKVDIKPIAQISAEMEVNNEKVQKFFTNACYKGMNKFVPMDTGDLATTVDIGLNYITYQSVYAHYQYVGISKNGKLFNYRKDKHPLACSHWAEVFKATDLKRVVKETAAYAKSLK